MSVDHQSSRPASPPRAWHPWAAAMALLVALAACSSPINKPVKPKHFDRQDEAGTGHVAVLAVARWEDYVTDLQPKFTLTAAEAFKQAGPTTAITEIAWSHSGLG